MADQNYVVIREPHCIQNESVFIDLNHTTKESCNILMLQVQFHRITDEAIPSIYTDMKNPKKDLFSAPTCAKGKKYNFVILRHLL